MKCGSEAGARRKRRERIVTLGELVAAVCSVTDDGAEAAAVINRFLSRDALRARTARQEPASVSPVLA